MSSSRRHFPWLGVVISMSAVFYLFKVYNYPTKQNTEMNWLESPVTIIDPNDLEQLNQRDPRLINYLKARHLTPPSKLPYNLNGAFTRKPNEDNGFNSIATKLFSDYKEKGFFVECGGYDGIDSHSLFLERSFGWTGLLIECNPVLIPELRKVHRKAYTADVCISVTEYPSTVNITSMDKWPASSSTGTANIFPRIKSKFTRFEVSAFPIYSIIAATGVTVVDFFILDVQSIEWSVMSNFPFDLMFVKVWIIEVALLSSNKVKKLESLMMSNGYRAPEVISAGNDHLYVHTSVPWNK